MSLTALGLSSQEADAYEWLVGRPAGTPLELVPRPFPNARTARQVLAGLEAKGLVTRSGAGEGRFVAAPPTVALGALLRRRRDELRQAEASLADLVDHYLAASPPRAVADVVEVVTDRQAVIQRFGQIQAGAREEVLAFVLFEIAAVSGEENVDEDDAVGRGVRYRVVAERAVLDRPGFLASGEILAAAGGGVRVTDSLPSRLLVADRSLAMVPVGSADAASAGGALLVHASPLLDLLIDVFEARWELASRVLPAPPPPETVALPPLDARILGLFQAGLTDRAVATQLGLSMRTVQRRVRSLMDAAGVDSRFQLGAEAARRGWVP